MQKGPGSLLKSLVFAAAFTASASYASVVSFNPNIDFSGSMTTIDFGGQDFILKDNGSGFPAPVSIKTVGNAAVSSTTVFGLMPASYFDPSPTLVFDDNAFLQYFSYASFATIPFSGPPTIIGLRAMLSDGFHYGYAEISGTFLKSYAFETVANLGIQSGAVGTVPEPGTWAMLLTGFGLIGLLFRRRKNTGGRDGNPQPYHYLSV
jgi:hypothetical protein